MSTAENEDFYALLGIAVTATTNEVEKAYRRAALKCHPDKVGPDDTKAAALFLLLTQANECLRDPAKRAVYDESHKARLKKKERLEKLDAKRRKDREDLEAREAGAFKKAKTSELNEAEIKRLREEGIRRLAEMARQEEEERKRDEAAKVSASLSNSLDHTLKLSWKKSKSGYKSDEINTLFSAFGEIETLLVKDKSAVLLFKYSDDAEKIFRKKESFKDFEISWAKSRKTSDANTNDTPVRPIISNATSGFSFDIGPTRTIEDDMLKRIREKELAKKISNE